MKHKYSPILRTAIVLVPLLAGIAPAIAQKPAQAGIPSANAQAPAAVTMAGKSTGTGSRLHTQSYFTVNSGSTSFTIFDSATYVYPSATATHWDSGIYLKYASGVWSPYAKTVQTYDAAGRVLTYEELGWKTSTSTYSPSRKNTYTYGIGGQVTDSLFQLWNSTTMAYVNSAHRINTFNLSGAITETIIQSWNTTTSAWVNKTRTVYNQNAQNMPLDIVAQTWSTSTSAWVNSGKVIYTYDATGLMSLTEIDQNWASATSTWQTTYRDAFVNDAAGHRLTDTYEQYNTTTTVFDKSGRITNSYDAAGNLLKTVSESYVTSSSSYVNSLLDSTTYNSYNQPLTQVRGLSWVSNAWTATTNSSYMFRNTYEPYHTPERVGTVAGARINVLPVPASETLQVTLAWDAAKRSAIMLTDMSGRAVRTVELPVARQTASVSLSVSTLPAGIYMLVVRDEDGGVTTRRIVVAH